MGGREALVRHVHILQDITGTRNRATSQSGEVPLGKVESQPVVYEQVS